MIKKLFLASAILLSCHLPLLAWHTNTHLQMTQDAVMLMPSDLQKLFLQNIRFLEPGIKDPDGLIRDYQNHYYLPMTGEGGAIERINKIIPVLLTKLKSGKNADAVKQYCYLAHYIADIWTPESLVKQDQGANNNYVANTPIVVLFEGYERPIDDFRKYFENRSSWRWTIENSEAVDSLLYNEAVNDIARTWLSVWQQSGRTVKPIGALIIDHKKGAFRSSYDRLPPQQVKPAGKRTTPLFKTQEEKEKWEQEHPVSGEPRDTAAEGSAIARSRLALKALLNPPPGFTFLECSLRRVGEHAYLAARLRNIGDKEIGFIAMTYAGMSKPFVQIRDLQVGEVAKIIAVLPPDATKGQIQYRYSEK
jgi:hypothetical protein